jgi:hypothetical protein
MTPVTTATTTTTSPSMTTPTSPSMTTAMTATTTTDFRTEKAVPQDCQLVKIPKGKIGPSIPKGVSLNEYSTSKKLSQTR